MTDPSTPPNSAPPTRTTPSSPGPSAVSVASVILLGVLVLLETIELGWRLRAPPAPAPAPAASVPASGPEEPSAAPTVARDAATPPSSSAYDALVAQRRDEGVAVVTDDQEMTVRVLTAKELADLRAARRRQGERAADTVRSTPAYATPVRQAPTPRPPSGDILEDLDDRASPAASEASEASEAMRFHGTVTDHQAPSTEDRERRRRHMEQALLGR